MEGSVRRDLSGGIQTETSEWMSSSIGIRAGYPSGGIRAEGSERKDSSGWIRTEGSERRELSRRNRAEGSEHMDPRGGIREKGSEMRDKG